jgi:hypothetical protein
MTDHFSEDQMCRAIAGQATPAELQHAAACRACRAELERSRGELAAFQLAVSGRAERHASGWVPLREDAPRAAGRIWAPALPAAALAIVLASLVSQIPASVPRQPLRQAVDVPWGSGVGTVSDRQAAEGEFFPLAYSHLPAASSRIVRLEVPAEALRAFGIEGGAAGRRPGAVLADVVIGGDGLARAVRFVRASELAR